MPHSRQLLGILLLFLAANLLLAWWGWDANFPEPAFVVLFGAAFAQVGLSAVWLVLGSWNIVLRAALLLGAVVAFSQPLAAATRDDYAEWMGILTAFAAMTAAPTLLLYVKGWRAGWTVPANAASSHRSESAGSRHDPSSQFSLGGLLLWITALGVFLAVARMMDFPLEYLTEVLLYLLGFTAVVVASLWAVWGTQPMWLRATVPLPAALAIGWGLGRIESSPELGMMGITAAESLVTIACLLTAHRTGLRFIPRTRNSAPQAHPLGAAPGGSEGAGQADPDGTTASSPDGEAHATEGPEDPVQPNS